MQRAALVLLILSGCSEFELVGLGDKPVEKGDLRVDPGLLDFGTVNNGGTVSDVVTLSSVGVAPVVVSAIEVAGAGAFSVTTTGEDLVLQPGESTEVIVDYTPMSAADTDQLIVESDAVEPSQVVELRGSGIYPALSIDPTSVLFESDLGETVTEEVTVTSVGTTDLELYAMVVQGSWFDAVGDIPITLPPGDSTTITVSYTPEVEGEIALGKLWLSTNTATGDAVVPLEGHQEPPCMGLGEAWDRGELSATLSRVSSSLRVENLSSSEDVCIDHWYVWLSEGSQDLGAGDMNGDVGDQYPYGSMSLAPQETVVFEALGTSGPAWYCMEKTQQTARSQAYTFTGARVPEPLLSYMREGDQDASWAWQAENAVIIAGRDTNLVALTAEGGSTTVGLRILNMGGESATADVRETIPAGLSASGFSRSPVAVETTEDGDTVYVFSVSLGARTETDVHTDTVYDEAVITYTLDVPACDGRLYAAPMETRWTDSDGIERTDTANPLLIDCG